MSFAKSKMYSRGERTGWWKRLERHCSMLRGANKYLALRGEQLDHRVCWARSDYIIQPSICALAAPLSLLCTITHTPLVCGTTHTYYRHVNLASGLFRSWSRFHVEPLSIERATELQCYQRVMRRWLHSLDQMQNDNLIFWPNPTLNRYSYVSDCIFAVGCATERCKSAAHT